MLKQAMVAVAATVLAAGVVKAADIETVAALQCDGENIVRVVTMHYGVGKTQAAVMRARAEQVLKHAAQRADKGGPCQATMQWGTEAAFDFPGMTRQGAHQTAVRVMQFSREVADMALRGRKGQQWGD